MLLGTSGYQNVVDASNYIGAPTSLEHARGFYHATNPGMFFRRLVPATQLFLLLALVVNWNPAPGFNRHDHILISLSSERHPVCRAADTIGGILRWDSERMGNRKLRSCRFDFSFGCFADGVVGPHRPRDRKY